jgi:hypothetical protein
MAPHRATLSLLSPLRRLTDKEEPRMPATSRRATLLALGAAAAAGAGLWYWSRQQEAGRVEALYETPLPPPDVDLRVFHLGHSLVGRNMPAMLAQLAGAGHAYESQLGWGTPLKAHWEPDVEIAGAETENAHERYREAKEALRTGDYDAIVLTEMVEIRDAIRYHASAEYLSRWAELARAHNPQARLYLYETWHHLDDDEGWLDRLDGDLQREWLGGVLYPALAGAEKPIYLIPAGQVFAAFTRALVDFGGVGGMSGAEDLFALTETGELDTIHFNDKGAYLVALTHFAVLYHSSPVGLPHRLNRADGSPAAAPSPEAAALMQKVVWDVVTTLPQTGVAA